MDSYWLWGYQNNTGSQYFGGTDIIVQPDSSLSYEANPRIMNIRQAFTCIADERGELLFYSNGYQVANGNHDTLENSRLYHDELITVNDAFGYQMHQTLLMLPYIGDSNKAYLFHTTLHDDNGLTILGWNMYCTILDKSLNHGAGGIVSANIPILEDKLAQSGLTAVQHANGRDWWLVMPTEYADEYYTILVAKDTIYPPVLQKVTGLQHVMAVTGNSVFTREGTKYARHEWYNTHSIYVMDFDRCTGLFSNAQSWQVDDMGGGGLAFSPNGKLLYSQEKGVELYQYRIDTTDIPSSKRLIAYDNGSGGFFSGFSFGNLLCDNKVYYTSNTRYLSVIHYPDKRGDSCMVVQNEITLPTVNGHTVPNYPNFYLGALQGSGCDTITTAINQPVVKQNIQVFPNPTSGEITFLLSDKLSHSGKLSLRNVLGQQVYETTLKEDTQEYIFDTKILAQGVFFYEIETGKNTFTGKFIVVK